MTTQPPSDAAAKPDLPGRGRPLSLTPALQVRICEKLRAGNFAETACALSGIDTTTYYRWMRAGKAADGGELRDFYLAVRTARAEAEADKIKAIEAAAQGIDQDADWRAAAWALERMYPDRWGRRAPYQLEHSGKNGAPLPTPEAETRVVNVQIVMPQNGYEAPDGDGDGD